MLHWTWTMHTVKSHHGETEQHQLSMWWQTFSSREATCWTSRGTLWFRWTSRSPQLLFVSLADYQDVPARTHRWCPALNPTSSSVPAAAPRRRGRRKHLSTDCFFVRLINSIKPLLPILHLVWVQRLQIKVNPSSSIHCSQIRVDWIQAESFIILNCICTMEISPVV